MRQERAHGSRDGFFFLALGSPNDGVSRRIRGEQRRWQRRGAQEKTTSLLPSFFFSPLFCSSLCPDAFFISGNAFRSVSFQFHLAAVCSPSVSHWSLDSIPAVQSRTGRGSGVCLSVACLG